MVKTTIIKYKDNEGKEQQSVFGDLLELYDLTEGWISEAQKTFDLMDVLFMLRNHVKKSIEILI